MSIKYKEVADQLKKDLLSNMGHGITRLPTEKELCEQFQVSRQTIRAALTLLEQEGLISKKQGSGSYITGLLPEENKNQVAVLLSSDTDYIFPSILSDIENILAEEGYSVAIFITHNRIDTERRILQALLSMPLRGMIVEPSRSALPTPNYDLYEKLSAKGTQIVFLHGYYSNLPNASYVKDDNYMGGFLLGQYLLRQHHKQIACLFQLDMSQGQERHLGFIRALMEQDMIISEENMGWFTQAELTLLQKKQDTRFLVDFIHQKLTSCSAIICHNDEIAYWLIKELSYMNISVPEDISVVSFDNSYLCELSTPRLSSLTHAPREMASAAVSLLIQKMRGQKVVSQKLSWTLVSRNSVAAKPDTF